MAKILVIHGPNLNLLGTREKDVYGELTIDEINTSLKKLAKENKIDIDIVQSNHEGDIVELIGKSKKEVDAILINPAAYTHTSVAIRDAISGTSIPTVEVHLSNIYAREEFRQRLLGMTRCSPDHEVGDHHHKAQGKTDFDNAEDRHLPIALRKHKALAYQVAECIFSDYQTDDEDQSGYLKNQICIENVSYRR